MCLLVLSSLRMFFGTKTQTLHGEVLVFLGVCLDVLEIP